MMGAILMFLLLSLLQFFCGLGILSRLKIRLKPALAMPLCVLLGLSVHSFLPFLLELLRVPITPLTVFGAIGLTGLGVMTMSRRAATWLKEDLRSSRFRVRIYEIPFLLVIGGLVFISVWRCFYLPPTPRDLTSGAEAIAEYAVREKTMINSLFTVNLESTNNQFKPPYITSLQVIYKFAGFPFGQVWLSVIVVSFIIFLYHLLNHYLHRLFSGLLLIIFLAVPEMYAYSFMALFDYPNAVYFFLSVYFLNRHFLQGARREVVLSGFLMGIATYIRSETLILAVLLAGAIAWHHVKNWNSGRQLLFAGMAFLLPPVLGYVIPVTVYIHHYLPVDYNVGGLVNANLLNPAPLVERFLQMNTRLIFSEMGIDCYGYFFFIFFVFLIVELASANRWTTELKNWLFAVMVIYFGYPLLGFLLPLLDIDHSTKRGLFKIFPLMLLFMGTASFLRRWSQQLEHWEKNW